MQWVKLHVSLRHNRLFQRLSKNAKLAFLGALMAAGEYDQNGALTTRHGPLTDAELASDLLLTRKESALAVKELVHFGFVEQLTDGSLAISKWDEKTAPVSTPRVRLHREKRRLETLHETLETLHETLQPVSRNGSSETDKEVEVDLPKATALGKATPKATPDWIEPLRSAVHSLGSKKLRSLSVDERTLVARYHCLTFANCTKSEANNKAKASPVAAGLASMSRNETYGDMSVRQYFVYGKQVHERREKTPWYDVWLIRSVVEFE